jgi:hypothetical protein
MDHLLDNVKEPPNSEWKEVQEKADGDLNRRLKWVAFWIIFGILIAEVLFLFSIIYFQGFHVHGFSLNDWVFGVFSNGCLIQTFFLIQYIVKHLYPQIIKLLKH